LVRGLRSSHREEQQKQLNEGIAAAAYVSMDPSVGQGLQQQIRRYVVPGRVFQGLGDDELAERVLLAKSNDYSAPERGSS